jgi:peptidoglycan/LPS O-acetylase OafA/YrhL
MRLIVFSFAIGALFAGLVAAWYWYQSTKVPLKTTQPDAKGIEMAALGLAAGAYEAYRKVSALNKKAALWTAASVVLGAISAVIGALNSN